MCDIIIVLIIVAVMIVVRSYVAYANLVPYPVFFFFCFFFSFLAQKLGDFFIVLT